MLYPLSIVFHSRFSPGSAPLWISLHFPQSVLSRVPAAADSKDSRKIAPHELPTQRERAGKSVLFLKHGWIDVSRKKVIPERKNGKSHEAEKKNPGPSAEKTEQSTACFSPVLPVPAGMFSFCPEKNGFPRKVKKRSRIPQMKDETDGQKMRREYAYAFPAGFFLVLIFPLFFYVSRFRFPLQVFVSGFCFRVQFSLSSSSLALAFRILLRSSSVRYFLRRRMF